MNAIRFCVLAVLCAGHALAQQVPQPVAQGLEGSRLDYRMTGLIEAPYSWGSGVVVEDNQVVLSCAHVVYDDIFRQWTSGARWYRAYNGSTLPNVQDAKPLNGYFFWRSYSSAVQAAARAQRRLENYPLESNVPDAVYNAWLRALAREFNLDAVAYFSYAQDLGGGSFARLRADGASLLASDRFKWITGYPGGRYPEGDPLEYRLHDTGQFRTSLEPEFPSLANYVTAYDEIETGSGNSGGPVWANANDSPDPVVAGILVSGAELQTEGESLVGVHATSAQSAKLVEAAMAATNETSQTKTHQAVIEGGNVPDAERVRVPGGNRTKEGQLVRTFKVRGLSKVINEVRVDLDIKHTERRDVRVVLQAPGKRLLPVYDGYYDTPGEDVKLSGQAVPLFYGLNPNGTWVLRIIDTTPADVGQLVSATVQITAR
jgi:hypothetical protein